MKLELGFGNGTQSAEVPDRNLKQILDQTDAVMESAACTSG